MKKTSFMCCSLQSFYFVTTVSVITIESIWITLLTVNYILTAFFYDAVNMDGFYFSKSCLGKAHQKHGCVNGKNIPRNFCFVIAPLYLIMVLKVYKGINYLIKGQTRYFFQGYYYTSVSFYVSWCFMTILILSESTGWSSSRIKFFLFSSLIVSLASWILLYMQMKFKDTMHHRLIKMNRDTLKDINR